MINPHMIVLKSSLDWSQHRGILWSKIVALPYNRDLRRMIENIDGMVRELSQIEVDARRTKSFRVVDAKLGVINGAIVTLEQWIMMAELIR